MDKDPAQSSNHEVTHFTVNRNYIISALQMLGSNNDVWPEDEEAFLKVVFDEADKIEIDIIPLLDGNAILGLEDDLMDVDVDWDDNHVTLGESYGVKKKGKHVTPREAHSARGRDEQ